MYAAIVKLDALANAVWPAAQHHDFFAIRRIGFALFLIGRVLISRVGGEFGGAGVDPLVHRMQLQLPTAPAHFVLVGAEQLGQATIRKAATF